MKKFLDYKFLMSILASVVVLLEVLVKFFKLNINIEAVISVTGAVVGVLMTIGVVEKKKEDKTIDNKEDLKDLLKDDEDSTDVKKEEFESIDENDENINDKNVKDENVKDENIQETNENDDKNDE